MFYSRLPFITGAVLHLILVFTRISVFEWRCVGNDCSGLFFADFPISLIYLAFSDGMQIVFSLLFGTLLWGLYGLGVDILLQKIMQNRMKR